MEIVIDERKDCKSTAEIGAFGVTFRDYDRGEDGNMSENALFFVPDASFEIAVKAWNEHKRTPQ